MLTSRKALIGNLNYVQLQQGSLGGRLSLRPEGTVLLQDSGLREGRLQDSGLREGSLQQWKEAEVMLVDANSNDPSVPCQCCEHSGHQGALCYDAEENLEALLCEEYLSPDELPLSPLSPSSPSTDSSSSSHFTLDDSPVSMYYKEYAQEELLTPDQQPDIIPLDAETEGVPPAPEDSISSSQEDSMAPALKDSMAPDMKKSIALALEDSIPSSQEESMAPGLKDSIAPALKNSLLDTEPQNLINNNMADVPFIDWSSDTMLDSNCNSLIDTQPINPPSSASTEVNRPTDPNQSEAPEWPQGEELLPGLPPPQDSSNHTPKKTITSFHELAQRRRRSVGQLAPPLKKDKSDWLIVFSPDVEQPPINELTASAFYHQPPIKEPTASVFQPQPPIKELMASVFQPQPPIKELMDSTFQPQPPIKEQTASNVQPQPPISELTASTFYHGAPQPLLEGKEVTTFRELRYRNTLNKQSTQQTRANKGPLSSADTADGRQTAEFRQEPSFSAPDTKSLQRETAGESTDQAPALQGCGGGPLPVRAPQRPPKMEPPKPPPRLRSQRGLQPATTGLREHQHPSTVKGSPESEAGARPFRTADGADRRGGEVYSAPPPSRLFLHFSTNLTPPPALSPLSSALEVPCYFAPPPQSWFHKFPVRLSPVGAFSPPQRTLLPLLDTPDLAILLSPLFPRYRSRKTGQPGAPTASSPDTGVEAEPLMADGGDDGAQQGKKSLLIPIGSAVDEIITHFNGSRNQVQKAQLGDTRQNPALGYLIAEGLCPTLEALLADGLKPFQKDVLIGRRRLSPWHLVEASAKTGPEPLRLLFCTVSRLQQLRDPQRFNAFIFSLLNAKQLEAWLSHLHQSYDELSIFYLPSGFLPLASSSRPEWWEELLLTLQPLSALTFHTDLLFEHHHLPRQAPPPQSTPLAESCGVPAFQHILDLGGWLAHNLTPGQSESCAPAKHAPGSLGEGGACSGGAKDSLSSEPASPAVGPPIRDWSRNWWGHLTQASRMYLPDKREPFTLTSLHKMTGWAGPKPRPQGSEETGAPEEPPHTKASLKTNKGGDPTARKQPSPAPEKAGWFGPLFGESSAHSREIEGQNASKSRRPSSWLPPHIGVLDLIRKRPAPEKQSSAPQQVEEEPARRPERTLRALCDHSASSEAQLSFQKGDVLQLLGTLDDDWIRCRRGNHAGLVPVAYTSLIL